MSLFVLTREEKAFAIGAVILCLVQLCLSPYLQIGYAIPNFILAFAVANAVVRGSSAGYVMPFVLGMVCDISGYGPIGAYALLFVIATLLASVASRYLSASSLAFKIAESAILVLLVHLLYALLLIACSMDVGFLDALLYRVLPCSIYDIFISEVLLLIFSRIGNSEPVAEDVKIISKG